MPDLTPILLREPTRDDWPAMERLIRAAWHADYCATGEVVLGIEAIEDKIEWLRDELSSFGSRFIVAEERGKIVGLAVCHVTGGRVWIDDLFVAPGERRQGIAQALVAQCAPADAAVYAEVNARNAGARSLFEKLGYERAVETIVFHRAPQG